MIRQARYGKHCMHNAFFRMLRSIRVQTEAGSKSRLTPTNYPPGEVPSSRDHREPALVSCSIFVRLPSSIPFGGRMEGPERFVNVNSARSDRRGRDGRAEGSYLHFVRPAGRLCNKFTRGMSALENTIRTFDRNTNSVGESSAGFWRKGSLYNLPFKRSGKGGAFEREGSCGRKRA